jgi:hypothetical protein
LVAAAPAVRLPWLRFSNAANAMGGWELDSHVKSGGHMKGESETIERPMISETNRRWARQVRGQFARHCGARDYAAPALYRRGRSGVYRPPPPVSPGTDVLLDVTPARSRQSLGLPCPQSASSMIVAVHNMSLQNMSNNSDMSLWPFPKKGLRAWWRPGKVTESFGGYKAVSAPVRFRARTPCRIGGH